MKLYELSEQFAKLEVMAEAIDTQEDSQAFSQLWEEINMAFEEKADNTACVIRNLKAEAEAIKQEEERLKLRRQALDSSAERLKSYLETHMTMNGIEKIKGKLFTVSIQKNPPSTKVDQSLLGDQYLRVKREPDLVAINAALKLGPVEGAWQEQGQSLRIR